MTSSALIPRTLLFGNPDKAAPRISRDGQHIAFLAPRDGVLNVWVAPTDDIASARPLTHDTVRGIRVFLWAYDNEHILYLQDVGGDENWRVYSVHLETGDERDLTPYDGVAAQIQEVSRHFPSEILVGLNDREPQLHDIYRVDIRTGERTLVVENPGFAGFLTDDDFNVRMGLRMTPEGGTEILEYKDGDWSPFAEITMEDSLTTNPIAFDKTGRVLYMLDSRERDTAGFFAVNLDTGEKTLVHADPRADVIQIMAHPTERTIQAAAVNYDRKRWTVLDEGVRADLEKLADVADGDIEVVSRTLDDHQWLVAFLMDDGPVRYYHFDRATSKATFLFTNRSALEGLPLAKMQPVVLDARDGLKLVCYLTLPAHVGERPEQPLPMVLLVHGGPWARDAWGYNPHHQWLANRGYAVLSVNFRGSTGFGKSFINASNKEWGAKMHDDLLDAVQWAFDEGIANPARTAIMGGSYGGYATLVGLTLTPETFACGVDIVGPSNLITLLNSLPPYWEPMVNLFTSRVGDHRTEEGLAFLASRSPITYTENIVKPLLIAQGANDPRVKQAESDQIVSAMQDKGISVTYVLYPDEGHGFARPQNSLSFHAITEAFLAEHLGGEYQPIGDDFDGASITVPAGADDVMGLEAALDAIPEPA